MGEHYRVVIIGGGTAGISTAARLSIKLKSLSGEIAVIDPSDKHYYQPLWTLVGAGAAKKEATVRNMDRLVPDGANWIKDSAASFYPEENAVHLENGFKVSYDYLVVAAGIEKA